MSWRELTVEGPEPRPWRPAGDGGVRPQARPGKLFVAVEPRGADGLQPHQLLLFTDDQVRQVARHLRK